MRLDPSDSVRIAPKAHSFVRGRRLILVDGDSIGWAALPLNMASALTLCDGRSVEEIEAQWHFPQVSARGFLEQLDDANLLLRPPAQNLLQVSQTPPQKHRQPRIFIMKLTERCNLRCQYCYDEVGLGGERMTLETFQTAVDFAFAQSDSRPLHFHFHGGEPLTNWPVFTEGAHYIRGKQQADGRPVSLSTATNGLLLNAERMQFLSEFKFGIRLSFDGLPDLHDLYRKDIAGGGTAEKVLEVIDLVRSNPDIRAWCILATITGQGSSHLPEIAAFLQSQGVPSVEFLPCRLQGNAQGQAELKVNATHFVSGLKGIVQMIEEGAISSLGVEALIKLMLPLMTGEFLHGCGSGRCGAGKDLMVIDPKGMIRPCDVVPKNAFLPLGSVHSGMVRDFVFEMERAAVDKGPDCGACPWLKPCRGGCPGAALADDGDFNDKYGFACELHLEMYPFLIEKISESPTLQSYFEKHYYRNDYRWMLNAD